MNLPMEGIMSSTQSHTPEPRYQLIRDEIMTAIREKRFRPNEQIPTELELMERYNVSRTTVRRAIHDLVENGTLVKRQGSGTFVNEPQFTRHLFRFISFTSDCLDNGLTPSTEVSPVEYGPPSPHVTQKMEFMPGENVYRFHRLRFINGEPVMIEFNEVPERYDFVQFTPHDALCSLMHLFEVEHGLTAQRYSSTLETSYATKQEADMLRTRIGAPVILIEGICMREDDKPLYYFKQIISGERCKLDISGAK